jgi:hypothetical protein
MKKKLEIAFAAAILAALIPTTSRAQAQPQKDSAAPTTAAPAPVPASASALDSYVGFYQSPRPDRGIFVTLEDGILYGEPTGGEKARLFLKSGSTYFVGREGSPATATFKLDAEGKPTALVLRRPDGSEVTFPKFK